VVEKEKIGSRVGRVRRPGCSGVFHRGAPSLERLSPSRNGRKGEKKNRKEDIRSAGPEVEKRAKGGENYRVTNQQSQPDWWLLKKTQRKKKKGRAKEDSLDTLCPIVVKRGRRDRQRHGLSSELERSEKKQSVERGGVSKSYDAAEGSTREARMKGNAPKWRIDAAASIDHYSNLVGGREK